MRTKRIRTIENPKQYEGQIFNGIQITFVYDKDQDELEYSCHCICHCGRGFNTPLWRIISGSQRSCGMCGNGKEPVQYPIPVRKSLVGQHFGDLTVVGVAGRNLMGRVTYHCICKCTRWTIVASNNLTSGNTKSCGRCNYAREAAAESQRIYTTPEEAHLGDTVYSDMKRRCYDPKFPEFEHYGAKGIGMCEEWRNSPKAYVDWCMSHGWKPGLSVDRIDNSKGYSPENCRIADDITQANNKTTNRRITVDGVEHTVADWARITGVVYDNLRNKTDDRMVEIIREKLKK